MTGKKVTIEELKETAASFVKELFQAELCEEAVVVGLYGELGSGKTAFTKEIARVLGVVEHVVSPTFVIERIYHIPERTLVGENKRFGHLIHIDAYRLENEVDLEKLGWNNVLADPQNLIFIEWPQRVKKILPKGHIQIHFKHIDEKTREISISI